MLVLVIFREKGSDLQSTESKDKHETNLLLLWELQLLEGRHGKQEDGNVGDNVDGSVGEPNSSV